MRNLRKLMAVIVSVAIMASLLVAPAFAEQTMTDVEVCELLDVLRGTGSGLTAEYLASKPQRYQAARLFLRLQGLEDDALAFEGTANFSDVEAMPDWQFAAENKAVLAYLYANPELGFVGYTDGTFRPFNEISAMEYYKVLLTALGYEQNVDYVYGDDLLDFAASLGLSEVADVEEFSIMHLATATVEALKAVVKDGEETLLEKLVADGVIDEDVAAETGIYEGEVVAAELAVESVTADNLAEVYVKFNQEMNKSTIKADYFKVAGEKVQAASLMADGVTVKLTVAKSKVAGSNGANYKVEVTKDVKSASGAALAEAYSTTIKVIDKELPYITGVELTGPKTIEITFSEPIKTKPTVKINKGVYGCSVSDPATATDVTSKIIVTIAASKLPEGNYTLAISDANDYAGFKMDADERTIAYAADDSPITAEVTSATQTQVKVKFNKPVKLTDTATTYFYHTYTAYPPTSVTPSDGSLSATYTLSFADNPIPEGQTQLVIKAKGSGGTAIQDGWGNKLEANIIITISVSADVTAPSVLAGDSGLKVKSQKVLELYFDEALDQTSAEDSDNYVIEDSEGKEIEIDSIAYSANVSNSEYKVTINFSDNLSGTYTISITGVTDNSVDKNEIEKTVLSFTVDDMEAPDLTEVYARFIKGGTGEKDVIYVYFPEKMTTEGKYSVIEAANYLFNGAKLPSKTTLELFGSTGTVVKITLPNDDTRVLTGKKLTVARVADLAGNASVLLSHEVTLTSEVRPAVEKIEQTAANKLNFVFDSILESVLADAFVIDVNGTLFPAAGVEEWTVKDNKTTVKVVLDADCVDEIKDEVDATYGDNTGLLIDDFGAAVTIMIDGEFVVAETGMTGADRDTAPVAVGIAAVDKWAPSYKSMTVTNNTYGDTTGSDITNDPDKFDTVITLDFSEAITATNAGMYGIDLVVKDAKGKQLTAATQYVTKVAGGDVVVIIPDVQVPLGDSEAKYTVASAESITYIKDVAGNKIATFKAKDVKKPS